VLFLLPITMHLLIYVACSYRCVIHYLVLLVAKVAFVTISEVTNLSEGMKSWLTKT